MNLAFLNGFSVLLTSFIIVVVVVLLMLIFLLQSFYFYFFFIELYSAHFIYAVAMFFDMPILYFMALSYICIYYIYIYIYIIYGARVFMYICMYVSRYRLKINEIEEWVASSFAKCFEIDARCVMNITTILLKLICKRDTRPESVDAKGSGTGSLNKVPEH